MAAAHHMECRICTSLQGNYKTLQLRRKASIFVASVGTLIPQEQRGKSFVGSGQQEGSGQVCGSLTQVGPHSVLRSDA